MKCKVYIATTSVLLFIVFIMLCVAAYNLLKNTASRKKKGSKKVKGLFQHIFDVKLNNSILCDLKKRLREKVKDFCLSNNISALSSASPQYGVFITEVGFEYLQNEISDLLNQIDDVCIAKRKILLLNDFISQTKDSIFVYSKYQEILVKCELQNIVCMRFLLKNVLDLVRNVNRQDEVALMRRYCVKLDASLAFISTGLNLVMKDIKVLNRIDSNLQIDDCQLFCDNTITFDDNAVNFFTISLHNVSEAV